MQAIKLFFQPDDGSRYNTTKMQTPNDLGFTGNIETVFSRLQKFSCGKKIQLRSMNTVRWDVHSINL